MTHRKIDAKVERVRAEETERTSDPWLNIEQEWLVVVKKKKKKVKEGNILLTQLAEKAIKGKDRKKGVNWGEDCCLLD